MDRLDAMRAFASVAELGSFAGAARRLRLSPASVTRAVALLEEQLGLMLLNRTTRSVKLTDPGAQYLETCRRVLADIEEADRRVRGESAVPRGMMSLAAPVMFGRLHVLPIVASMLRRHPDLSVRMLLSDRLVHLVEEGIDAAVRIGQLADSALMALKVGEVRRVVLASPDYLATRGVPATPSDLARHDLIAFEAMETANDWQFGAGRTSVRVQPRLAVNTAEAALAAAEAGLGITRTLSYQAQAALAAGRLRMVLEEHAPAPIPVNMVYPARRQGSANLAAFLDEARAHFRALPVIGKG
jgi:DNA-binding transcriptional LysR family regulator